MFLFNSGPSKCSLFDIILIIYASLIILLIFFLCMFLFRKRVIFIFTFITCPLTSMVDLLRLTSTPEDKFFRPVSKVVRAGSSRHFPVPGSHPRGRGFAADNSVTSWCLPNFWRGFVELINLELLFFYILLEGSNFKVKIAGKTY